MNPKEQHFGLGDAKSVDALIVWPNGERQTLRGLAANRRYTLVQGAATAVVGGPGVAASQSFP
jgi:hypothetical protein